MARRKRKSLQLLSFPSLFLFFFALGAVGLVFQIVRTLPKKQQQLSHVPGSCVAKDLSGAFVPGQDFAFFNNQEVPIPKSIAHLNTAPTNVLGTTNAERWVEVDLSDQKIFAWEGDTLFTESLISTGKWGWTPVGEFYVWMKLRYTTMSGGDPAIGTYYNLPNVPYTMFFSNAEIPASRGYALHGAYWHNNFGQVMSHGCVNLPVPVAKAIFNWAGPVLPEGNTVIRPSIDNPALRIVIHE